MHMYHHKEDVDLLVYDKTEHVQHESSMELQDEATSQIEFQTIDRARPI